MIGVGAGQPDGFVGVVGIGVLGIGPVDSGCGPRCGFAGIFDGQLIGGFSKLGQGVVPAAMREGAVVYHHFPGLPAKPQFNQASGLRIVQRGSRLDLQISAAIEDTVSVFMPDQMQHNILVAVQQFAEVVGRQHAAVVGPQGPARVVRGDDHPLVV